MYIPDKSSTLPRKWGTRGPKNIAPPLPPQNLNGSTVSTSGSSSRMGKIRSGLQRSFSFSKDKENPFKMPSNPSSTNQPFSRLSRAGSFFSINRGDKWKSNSLVDLNQNSVGSRNSLKSDPLFRTTSNDRLASVGVTRRQGENQPTASISNRNLRASGSWKNLLLDGTSQRCMYRSRTRGKKSVPDVLLTPRFV